MTSRNSNRRLSFRYIHAPVVAAIVFGAATTGDAQAPPLIRVRSNTPSIAAVIHVAAERSTAFRHLIATIGATDGLVYVDDGKCGHNVSACLQLSVTVAGPHRLLRILVDLNATQQRLRDHGLDWPRAPARDRTPERAEYPELSRGLVVLRSRSSDRQGQRPFRNAGSRANRSGCAHRSVSSVATHRLSNAKRRPAAIGPRCWPIRICCWCCPKKVRSPSSRPPPTSSRRSHASPGLGARPGITPWWLATSCWFVMVKRWPRSACPSPAVTHRHLP